MSSFLSGKKKFLATLTGVVFAGLAAQYPQYQAVIKDVSVIILGYLTSEALVDHARANQSTPLVATLGSTEESGSTEEVAPAGESPWREIAAAERALQTNP